MLRHPRIRLEALEDRWLPTTIVWTGAVNARWDLAANWDLNQVPTASDVAVIDKAGAVVEVRSGSHQVAQLVSTQTLEVIGGALTLGQRAGPSTLANLRLFGGTLDVQRLELTTSLVWGGGTLSGGTLIASGVSTFSGGNKTLDGIEFRNLGSLTWSSGRVRASGGGSMVNGAAATFTINASDVPFDPALTNLGKVMVASPGAVEAAAVTQSGTLLLGAGTFRVARFNQTDGVTRLEGGGLASMQAITLQGGSLVGSGKVSGEVNSSGAVIAPGGTIAIAGGLVLGGGAGVDVSVVVGGGGDLIAVSGQAVLGGELIVRLTGGGPVEPTAFVVLTADGVVGGFVSVQAVAPGVRASATVGPKAVTVVVVPNSFRPGGTIDPRANVQPDDLDDGLLTDQELKVDPAALVEFFDGFVELSGGQLLLKSDQVTAMGEVGGGGDLGGVRRPAVSPESGRSSRLDETAVLDDVLSALPAPALPDLELASDADLLGAADLAASLLLGGRARARLSSQGGAAVSAVATVFSGDDVTAPVGPADPDLSGLMVDPIGQLGDWPDVTASAPPPPVAVGDLARAMPGAALTLGGLVLIAIGGQSGKSGSRREGRMRREDGERWLYRDES